MNSEIKRGYIYEFSDGKSETPRYVVTVSANYRSRDRLINTIMFGDFSKGHDVVAYTIPDVGEKYLHCGLITYADRSLLVREVCKVSNSVMRKIDDTIRRELGIDSASYYKRAYDDLVSSMAKMKQEEDNGD